MDLFKNTETHMRNAGRIAGEALAFGSGLIKEGALLLEVAEAVEAFIVDKGGSVAFPVNIAINSQAAHFTPSHDDDLRFRRGDVVKLDVGAHQKGYIGDTALTVEVGTHHCEAMIRASRAALDVALDLIRPGVSLAMVGGRIEETIKSFGFRPIRNLTGHSMERYNLHAGLSIPNINEKVPGEVRAGQLIAIEPFATDGAGKVDGHKKSNIYRLHREDTPLKGPSKDLVKGAQKEFRTLPFSERWAARRVNKPAPILQQLVRQRAIQSYPILNDVKGGTVTQAEHTILITEDGCDVLTRV